MRDNKKILIFCLLISSLLISIGKASELFNFKIKEIQITQDGNLIKGFKGGEANTDDGISIKANYFEYDKSSTVLKTEQNVRLEDNIRKILINAEKISYLKNLEEIYADGNVKINDLEKNIKIDAKKIFYSRSKDELIANGDVSIIDGNKKIKIFAEKILYDKKNQKIRADINVKLIDMNKNIELTTESITYLNKDQKIFTNGSTEAEIFSKYNFKSDSLSYDINNMVLDSYEQTVLKDKTNFGKYELSSFKFKINDEFLKGTDIKIVENSNLPKGESNELLFKNGFFDLKNNIFKTGATQINLRKNIFGNSKNDPRLLGISSSMQKDVTSVKKAVFTSCKKNEKCPPWQLQASEIKHNRKKKQMIYDNALLKFYNVPIFYFPKFFHPDLTVSRQSGFLLPRFNNSNILGSSISTPYFYALSENKDFTFTPTLFSKSTKMIQTEFRQKNKNSFLTADFGFSKDFKSSQINKKKNTYHFFSKFSKNLEFKDFIESSFNLFVEKVNKDTYLKIFDGSLASDSIKPPNADILTSGFDFFIENESYKLSGGASVYEDLTKKQNDRYQYVFPYYNYSTNLKTYDFGSFDLSSKGNNTLNETNKTKTEIINNLNFKTNDKILEKIGLKNNLNFYFKNSNSLGKNIPEYKNSPEVKFRSLVEFNSELPLIKINEKNIETLIPRLSLKFNPSEMKNNSDANRKIDIENIFDSNRLSLDDSLEPGKSITIGTNYKKQNNSNRNNFIEYKLATVFRDKHENSIPSETSLNKRNSNLFGSVNYSLSKNFKVDYNFATDNKVENFVYNSLGVDLSINNFITTFNFIEEESTKGNTNSIENITKYNIDNNNSLAFRTRKNREISLTEYYDLVYEYKNDCLTAGVKFNKTYYEDRDLKPSKNIMFSISFYPLTTIEQSFK